jgi:hypothetical protein
MPPQKMFSYAELTLPQGSILTGLSYESVFVADYQRYKNIGTKNNRCKKLSEKAFLREDKKEGKRFIQDEDLTKT